MLPKIDLPKYQIKLPVSGKQVDYRPFTVKEEKILLMSKETKTPVEIVSSILQVVDNCTYGKIDLNTLPIADLEYLFLQIRIKSEGEISELQYVCKNKVDTDHGLSDCNGIIDIDLNLSDIVPTKSEVSPKIKLTDKIGIAFRFPTVDDSLHVIQSILSSDGVQDGDVDFIYQILDFIWDGDEVFPKAEISPEDLKTWTETLRKEDIKKIKEFVDSIPVLSKTIHTSCPKCGHKSKITLQGLNDFF